LLAIDPNGDVESSSPHHAKRAARFDVARKPVNEASGVANQGGVHNAQGRWTLLSLLNWTTGYFRRAGVEAPRLNAELLLGKAAGLSRIMLYANFDQEAQTQLRDELRELVRRRARGCPLQYLLGHWEFYGRSFEVTPAVMVPRQETELLVDTCLEKVPGDGAGAWAADVGTGSGVVAVTLACERAGLRVAATDSSAEALEVAARNAERNGVADRVAFAHGRLCESLAQPCGSAPVLVASNPPYVPTARIEELAPEIRLHEPREALDGGPDGLDVIRELVPAAAQALGAGGWLVLELGEGQAEPVREIVAAIGLLDGASVETSRDAGGCERVLSVRKKTAG